MTLTVFGASGKTGKFLLEQALGKGHKVRAVVRDKTKLGARDGLEIIEASLNDAQAVSAAIAGSDAVVSCLGPSKGSDEHMMAQAANTIIAAMKTHKVKRLLWQSGAGCKGPNDLPSFSRVIVRGIMKLVAAKVLADSQDCFDLIRATQLDWTVARVPLLSVEPFTGKYAASMKPPRPAPLSRADVADFLLTQVNSSEWIGKSPFLEAAK